MKEQRTDTDKDLIAKQLHLKNNQIETYQKEINNQRLEITKLRDRIKDLMSRGRQPVQVEGQESGANNDALIREREEHKQQVARYQAELQHLTASLNEIQNSTRERQS